MKFIEKQTECQRTGASATYHVVTGLQVDYMNNSTFVTMGCQKRKKTKVKNRYL